MCGIAGHLAFPQASPQAARKMADALAHRGPDGAGDFFEEGPVALSHRRLSIIDLATGAQPMRLGALAVVFNGEIYNYRELREELGAKSFRTASDTEVLLRLYQRDGEAMLPRLRGMFAFALWDGARQRLLLARDAFGEKPLVYCASAGQLWFASEAPALRAGGAPLGAIDRRALSDYLELLYIPAPRSAWTGMQKLPAGHLLVADERGVEVRRWHVPPVPGLESGQLPTAAGGGLRALLEDAVRLQLRSDVPVGALLSGGLDSSTVVALMARELGPGVRTFAVGFGEPDDELPFARAVAERCGTTHQELIVAPDPLAALAACGEPFGDSSIVPVHAVFQEIARAGLKVVLTGDGGDELFAGYGRYARAARLPHWPRAAFAAALLSRVAPARHRSRLLRGAAALGSRGAARARALCEVFSPAERRALLHGDAGVAPFAASDPPGDVDAALAFDLDVYLPDDLLYKVDTASMRFGVESRAPLLDLPLARAVVPLPAAAKAGKRLLKAAVEDLLPAQILAREKRGFGSPVARWLSGPLRPMLDDLVRSPSARIRTFLDPREVDRTLARALAPRGNPHQAWALFALEVWARAN
jgi:asparagine synthase (glutamine-hydrolysing)